MSRIWYLALISAAYLTVSGVTAKAQEIVITVTVPAAASSNLIELLDQQIDPKGAGANYQTRAQAWIRRIINKAVHEYKGEQAFKMRHEQARQEVEAAKNIDLFR